MAKKRSRLRGIGRWGVYVGAVICSGLLVALWWVEFEWTLQRGRPAKLLGLESLRVHLEDTRLVVYFRQERLSPYSSEGWSVMWMHGPADRADGAGWLKESSWWTRPFLFAHGDKRTLNGQGVDLPLVYPAALMVGWSVWLIRGARRRRRAEGCCTGCGYSLAGIGGGVCPECGANERVKQDQS